MATKRETQPGWSTLPSCTLTSIAKLLPTRLDIRRYRAVCRQFRQSITLSSEPEFPYPNLEIPVEISSDPMPEDVIVLRQSNFYAIEPLTKDSETRKNTETWILRVEEMGSRLVSVKNPFFGKDFPITSYKFSSGLNLLDYRVKVMGNKIYRLDINVGHNYSEDEVNCIKVVVSDDGPAIMALHYYQGLMVWRNGDEDWTDIDGFKSKCEDIIYHKEKFYAVLDRNIIITVDPKSLDVTEIGSYKIPSGHARYLVKSFNDLYLFVKNRRHKYDNYTIGFRVFKFDELNNEFVSSENAFRNRVVFIGDDFAFSVSATEFPGLRRNCVYLHDHIFYNNMKGPSVVVYDLEKNYASPLSAFPNITFWPPPTWLKSATASSRR